MNEAYKLAQAPTNQLTAEKSAKRQNQNIQGYYQFQSTIYDATRWAFLFGRNQILDYVPFNEQPKEIIEVGCGTGRNLKMLHNKYPKAHITGIDVSSDMLGIASKKTQNNSLITLEERTYCNGTPVEKAPDLVLFSYVLTMINPQYSDCIIQAYKDLKRGGKIAVVDFHSTPNTWFKKHMQGHHVRMEGQLDELLQKMFKTLHFKTHKAYGGLWNYFYFVGEKK